MATIFDSAVAGPARPLGGDLARPGGAIGGPLFDFLLLWGSPALAFLITGVSFAAAAALPEAAAELLVMSVAGLVAILTYAHLIAVAPRAYLNRDVFGRFAKRLVIVPVLLVTAFTLSHTLLVLGIVLAVFWDVHHSAMQTFGLGRIYDLKAGNDPLALRPVDMALNWALYVGPLIAGASLIDHLESFDQFASLQWQTLASVPAASNGWSAWARWMGVGGWLTIVAWAAWRYALAAKSGYLFSAHKRALFVVTGTVSILAWGFAPPLIAFTTVNLFHAVQYFALVWLKEGKRITGLAGERPRLRRRMLPIFVGACFAFGLLYWWVMTIGEASASAFLAPFIACSLLHFWFDGFVWSVRAKQV